MGRGITMKTTFTETSETTMTAERSFDASLDAVWEAFTTQHLLDQWWAPLPWKCITKEMDFNEGGQWTYVMQGPEGDEHGSLMQYKSIDMDGRCFVAKDAFANEDGSIDDTKPGTEFRFELTDEDGKTVMRETMTFASKEDMEELKKMGFQQGFDQALDQLDALLVSR